MHEIGGRAIEDHQLHGRPHRPFQFGLQIETEPGERGRRLFAEQQPDIDVTGRPRGAPGDAPEQVGRGDFSVVSAQRAREALDDFAGGGHGALYRPGSLRAGRWMIRRAGEGEYDPPTADAFEHMPYSRAQVMPDSIYPPGLQQDWRSGVLTGLIDAAIETITRLFATVPSRRSVYSLAPSGPPAALRAS